MTAPTSASEPVASCDAAATSSSLGERQHTLRYRGPRVVAVPLALLEDGRLNGWARTLGAWIAGRPDNWKFYPRYIRTQLSLGRDAYLRARRELIDTGWLMTETVRHGGRYESPEWIFCSDNQPPAPVEGTEVGKPDSGLAGVGAPEDIYRGKRTKSARAKRAVDNPMPYHPLPKPDPGHKAVPRPRRGQTLVPPQAEG